LIAVTRPFTTREQLARLQERTSVRGGDFVRESRSMGATGTPVRWLDTRDDLERRANAWRAALVASGVTQTDRILLALPTESAVGWDCLSATPELGGVTRLMHRPGLGDVLEFGPSVLITTPTEALRLARLAVEQQVDLTDAPLQRVVVTGEPGGSIGNTRRSIEERFGATCLDVYALTEVGVVGWGCGAADGIHLNEHDFDVEAIGLDSEREFVAGELGELVLTTRGERSTPLERYRTGDLVRLSREPCACGGAWIKAAGGVLGRIDERFVVRGVELLPSIVEHVVRRHPAVADYRLRVYRVRGECELGVEIEPDQAIASEGDRARVAAEVSEDLKRSFGLRLQCDVVAPSSLGDQDAGLRARRLRRQ
jgi:phenylacetate-CoA ligase